MVGQRDFLTDDASYKEGEWDARAFSVFRLHKWLEMTNMDAYSEDHLGRKKALDRFYSEIKTKLKKKEKEDCNKAKEKAEEEQRRIEIPLKSKHKVSTNLPALLDEYEDRIRFYADEHSLLIPNKGDPSKAILN